MPGADDPCRRLPAGLRAGWLTTTDVDAWMAIEQRAYPHPWTRGNFIDSIVGGHRARGLWDEEAGGLVGYSIALAGVGEWHLLNLTVHPERQGQGLARWLLDDLSDAVPPPLGPSELAAVRRPEAPAVMWLEVRESNDRARRLYSRYGFEVIGQRRAYYPAGIGRREDAIVMCLRRSSS